MTFTEAVHSVFHKKLTIQGRASRSEFWWTILFISLINIGLFLISFIGYFIFSFDIAQLIDGLLSLVAQILSTIYTIFYGARRLHDIDKSAWWLLLYITIIGALVLLVFYVLKGTEGPNSFGEDPLAQNLQNPTVA